MKKMLAAIFIITSVLLLAQGILRVTNTNLLNSPLAPWLLGPNEEDFTKERTSSWNTDSSLETMIVNSSYEIGGH